jgi:hypothetical protein
VPDKKYQLSQWLRLPVFEAFLTRLLYLLCCFVCFCRWLPRVLALIMFRYSADALTGRGLSDELVVERVYCCGHLGLLQIHPAENGLPSPWLIRTIRTSQLRHSFTIVSTNTIRATNANQAFTEGKK